MPHPNAHRRFTFIIDAADCIEQTHRHWDEFAMANGAEFLPSLVLGAPLMDFFCGESIKRSTAQILEAVRADGVTRHYPFRCDSATVTRKMEMEVSLLPEGRLRLQSRIIREESRPAAPLIQTSETNASTDLLLCPNCRMANQGGQWIEEAEVDASAEAGPLVAQPELCPTCCDLMKGIALRQAA